MNPALLTVTLGTLALLLIASAAILLQRPSRERDELIRRLKTWWVIAPLFLMALLPGRAFTLAFFAIVSFLALREYFSLIPTRRADRRVLLYAYASIPLQFAWVQWDRYGMFAIFIPVYMFLLIPLRMLITGHTDGFLSAVGTLYWGLMTTVYCLSHVGALLLLPHGGVGLVLYVVVLTQWNDVMQYIWGRSLGHSKVLPSVSPGKTWAGLIGGICSTIALSIALAPFLTPLTRWESVLAGALIGLGGFLGDVTVSAVKRDLNHKDTGTMLPGHGGILDRIDSFIYTGPLFFHMVRYLHF